MAQGNFKDCLKVTLSHEGLWSDHPADPGGATMKGITIGRFRQYKPNATKSDLRNISDAMVERIYRDDYWKPVRGDDLPFGVDLSVFDFGVNSGPSRAARYLQSVVGAKQDGIIGPETIKKTILAGGKEVIQKLCAKRGSFYRGLKTFAVFGKGWMRRLADVEAKSVAMWLANGASLAAQQRKELGEESKKASDKATQQGKGAAGTVGGGGIAGGTDTIMTGEPNWLLFAGIAVVVIAVAGLLILKSKQNKERAAAYAREAIAA